MSDSYTSWQKKTSKQSERKQLILWSSKPHTQKNLFTGKETQVRRIFSIEFNWSRTRTFLVGLEWQYLTEEKIWETSPNEPWLICVNSEWAVEEWHYPYDGPHCGYSLRLQKARGVKPLQDRRLQHMKYASRGYSARGCPCRLCVQDGWARNRARRDGRGTEQWRHAVQSSLFTPKEKRC